MESSNFKAIKAGVRTYVNAVDPWHLIEMGAPEDEYESQVDRIVSMIINKKPGNAELESELRTIFATKEFELESNKITDLAERIIKVTQ